MRLGGKNKDLDNFVDKLREEGTGSSIFTSGVLLLLLLLFVFSMVTSTVHYTNQVKEA